LAISEPDNPRGKSNTSKDTIPSLEGKSNECAKLHTFLKANEPTQARPTNGVRIQPRGWTGVALKRAYLTEWTDSAPWFHAVALGALLVIGPFAVRPLL
jgi:hypothetical protein